MTNFEVGTCCFIAGAATEAIGAHFLQKSRIGRLLRKDIEYLEAKAKALRKLLPMALVVLAFASCTSMKKITKTTTQSTDSTSTTQRSSRFDSTSVSHGLQAQDVDIDLLFQHDSAHESIEGLGQLYRALPGTYYGNYLPTMTDDTLRSGRMVLGGPFYAQYDGIVRMTNPTTGAFHLLQGGNLIAAHIHIGSIKDSTHVGATTGSFKTTESVDVSKTTQTVKTVEKTTAWWVFPVKLFSILLLVIIVVVIIYAHIKTKL